MGLGIGMAGPIWLVSSTLLSLWGLWFGVGLVRAERGDPNRIEHPDPGGRETAQ